MRSQMSTLLCLSTFWGFPFHLIPVQIFACSSESLKVILNLKLYSVPASAEFRTPPRHYLTWFLPSGPDDLRVPTNISCLCCWAHGWFTELTESIGGYEFRTGNRHVEGQQALGLQPSVVDLVTGKESSVVNGRWHTFFIFLHIFQWAILQFVTSKSASDPNWNGMNAHTTQVAEAPRLGTGRHEWVT